MANKVKYGLSHVYFAKATIAEDNTATYDKPVAWPGAVSMSLDAEGDTNTDRADNTDYFTSISNSGYSGTFECELIPDSFRQTILGDIVDSDGVVLEDANAKTQPFAFLFQFEGDASNTRYVFYNATAGRPSIEGETTGDTIEPKHDSVTFNAKAIYIKALDKNVTKGYADESNSLYATWFDTVHVPTALKTEESKG